MLHKGHIREILAGISASSPLQDEDSLCNYLWQCYVEYTPASGGDIRLGELTLEPFFQALPLDLADDLFGSISDLCVIYQRTAFLDGLRMGVRLSEELQ